MNIPLMNIQAQNSAIQHELEPAVLRCMANSTFCLGPEVETFEADFAKWLNIPYCVGCNSGTSALHLAAELFDISPGDEVLTTPFTFVSTAWAISYMGAKPVFADIEEATMNLDPHKIEERLSPRVKAIFAVHLFGQMCDIQTIESLARKYGLHLLEDAAQAHGACRDGVTAGTYACIGTFSFYPGKNLGALGEGGALVTSNSLFDEKARALRNHGSNRRYFHDDIGYNYRMEGIQAAALAVKLKYLDAWTTRRRELAEHYHEAFEDLPLRLTAVPQGSIPSYHLYVIRHPDRDQLADHLGKNGVGTGLHYPMPLHLQACYADLGYKEGDFPVAEKAANECLSLPLFPEMTDTQQAYVCEQVIKFFKN